MEKLLKNLSSKIIDMDPDDAAELTEQAVEEGIETEKILKTACIPAMEKVGEEYESGERHVPGMLLSAEAMKNSMKIIRPLLAESGIEPEAKIVIGTVEGDLHDIGQNLVAMMLEGAGFEVNNLGTETTADQFIDAIEEDGADVLGMSALFTTTRSHMPEVIEALEEKGLKEETKVIIGGAPVTDEFAERIGADRYAPDAVSATRLVKELLKK